MSHPVPPERSKRDDRCKEPNMQQIFRVKGLSVTYTLSCVAMNRGEPRGTGVSIEVVNPTEILARFFRALLEACCNSIHTGCISGHDWDNIVWECYLKASKDQPDTVLGYLDGYRSLVSARAMKMDPLPWATGLPPSLHDDLCSSASRRWTNQRNKNVKQLVDWYLVRPPEFVTLHDVGDKYREVVGEDHIAAVAKQAWIAGEHSVRYSCYDLHLRWVPIQNFLNQVDVVDWALVTKAEAMYLLAMRGWPYSVSDIYLNAFGPVSPIQLRELPN